MKTIIYWLDKINKCGWLFVVGHFIHISFSQDLNFKNGGYDILSFKSNVGYYTGLVQNNPYWGNKK